MRLLRTADGGFLNIDKIERLVDERGAAADGWVAVCENGEEIALARYYSAPGRAERELHDLVARALIGTSTPSAPAVHLPEHHARLAGRV